MGKFAFYKNRGILNCMGAIVDSIAKCDVIEPAVLVGYQIASGGNWIRLEFRRDAGWSGHAVETHLKNRYGIEIHGRGFTFPTEQYPGGTLFFHAKRRVGKARPAAWIEYILLRDLHLPLVVPIDPRNVAWAAGKGVIPGRRRKGNRAQRRFIKSILQL